LVIFVENKLLLTRWLVVYKCT